MDISTRKVSYRSNSYFEITVDPQISWRDFRNEAYREYRRAWIERPASRDPGAFPLHLDIDPTNACNLKCRMCPRTHFIESNNPNWAPDGRIGFMSWDLFRHVVDQAAAEGAYSIKLNYLGEPLLHPRMVDMVKYAKDRGLEVMMNTNATLLTEEVSLRLLTAGLDDIFFSVDSPYPEEYERIRQGASFRQVIFNIHRFLMVKEKLGFNHVQTRVSMVLTSQTDPQAKEDYIHLFQNLGVAEIGFGLGTEMDVDYWQKYGPIPGFTCRDPYNRMFIYWDGLIGPCCGEWERGFIVGDAWSDELIAVWRNGKYQQLRTAHEEGRYHDISICRSCSVPWLSQREENA